jgi:preprotein translocase subunit SecA
VTAGHIAARYAVACGVSPEREYAPERTWLSSPWARARALLLKRGAGRATAIARERESVFRALGETALDDRLRSLRRGLRGSRVDPTALAEALAIAREAAARSVGQRPFDEQIFGASVLLRGGLAEMATGEGKTLTAALAGSVAAVSGAPVHVLSSNDYLVSRDSEAMAPLYARMGLRVGSVLAQEPSIEIRAAAYRCDVTYLTPRELAFDYLRDREALRGAGPLGRRVLRIGCRLEGGIRQRGLNFAIVDEADDVLLDQARTPFVLSGAPSGEDASLRARAAMALARDCVVARDTRRVEQGGPPRLTDEGAARVMSSGGRAGSWSRSSECREWVDRALFALYCLERDVDYVLRDGAVEIVDGPTGRRSPQHSFERALHQLLEAKEGLDVSVVSENRARIAGQALFRRYRRLAAMTGTAAEARGELWRVYGLPVLRVPLRRPLRREVAEVQCHLDDVAQAEAVIARVEGLRAIGRPVLVATGSVDASRQMASSLRERGIETLLLNAADDAEEARVVSQAGLPGRVTVATNMAGRGTDIVLAPEVAQRGGLHVVCARVGSSRRVDRQLLGRCGRQGDPGSFEAIVSLGDPCFGGNLPASLLRWLRERSAPAGMVSPRIARALLWGIRIAEEKRAEAARRGLLAMQRGRDQLLAFAGKPE